MAATATRAAFPEPGLDLVNGILACSSFGQIADTLLPRLTRFFDAGSSCAFEMRRCGERKLALGRATQIRMPLRAIADYGAHFVDLDPVCAPTFGAPQDPRAVAPNAHRVVRLSDRCARGELMGSSYYNEFLREIDVQHVFGLMVRPECDPDRVLVLGFHRPKSGRDFGHELDQAAALAPALHATVERMAYRARLAPSATGELRLRLSSDARLLSVQGDAPIPLPSRPLYVPALRDRLDAVSRGETEIDGQWRALLGDVGLSVSTPGTRIAVQAASMRPDGTREYRLQLRASASYGFDLWAERVRLTPREAEVAQAVVRGLRNVDVAGTLGLSLRTVENHLRSIFAKAGVRSRTQLLSRALGSR